jgi:ElaB/YqjD/DUF883 family membrane-anchored ribosome-binding protein
MSSKILTVTLETKYYQSSVVVRRISHASYGSIELSDVEYQDVLQSIPTYWHTEKDKLIRFIFFDDKTYFCERQKEVFNYTTRQSELKIYRFDNGAVSNEEAEKLYNFFIEKFAKIKIERNENLYDSILEEIRDMSYIKYSFLTYRDNLLKQSDYIMLSDIPISVEEREKWTTYRQELRDITKQEAWISNDITNIKIPVSPLPGRQLNALKDSMENMSSIPNDLLQELVSNNIENTPYEDIVKNVAEISIKFEIIRSISKMKIPILATNGISEILSLDQNINQDIQNFANEMEESMSQESPLPKEWWEAARMNLDKKIEDINNTLSRYNVDFTIGDIIDSVIKDTKKNIDAYELIDDLSMESLANNVTTNEENSV